MNLEIGKTYVTRSGLRTPPLEADENGTNYKFGAWLQEPERDAKSWCVWLQSGAFISDALPHRLDLIGDVDNQAQP